MFALARSLTITLVGCLALYCGIAPALALLDDGVNITESASGAPVITAKPEHVKLIGEKGSTEIQWDTGNGSLGLVFVTENGKPPVLFAKGSRGTRVAPWIRQHQYVFELYGDHQRRALLAKVTVSGFIESVSSQARVSWQSVAQLVLIVGLAA